MCSWLLTNHLLYRGCKSGVFISSFNMGGKGVHVLYFIDMHTGGRWTLLLMLEIIKCFTEANVKWQTKSHLITVAPYV